MIFSSMRGTSAEQHVAAQALRRGFNVALPLVDLGADLYVRNTRGEFVSVQVKTAKRHRGAWRLLLRDYGDTVDVYVAVTPDFEKLWIVPASAVARFKHNVTLGARWRDRWTVFESIAAFKEAKTWNR